MDYTKIAESMPRTPQIIEAITQRLSHAISRHEKAMSVLGGGYKQDVNKIIWMVEVVPVIHAYTELLKAYGEQPPQIEI